MPDQQGNRHETQKTQTGIETSRAGTACTWRCDMEVDSEMIYQVVMKRGHTLDFEREEVRDFVFELLKAQDKRLGRMEILNMDVPTRDDVLALMDEYESDEARIEELEAEAEELQAELDDLILRDVYDLDDEDVEVVEEFLEVW